jgi:low temperature requirement protein LtrA
LNSCLLAILASFRREDRWCLSVRALSFGRTLRLSLQHLEETCDPVRASRYAVNGLMGMVAGLIAVAVANEMVIAHPHGGASAALSLLLYGGPILYLVAQGWYLWAVPRVSPRQRLIGSAALVLVGLATLSAPPYVALIVVGATLWILAVLDRDADVAVVDESL